MKFDLNLIRVFDALMTERRVSLAAERIGLTQPALSNALARLRIALGDELFTRSPSGMQPTPFAVDIAPTIREALRSLEQAIVRRTTFDCATGVRRFRIAMTDIGEAYFLPKLMHYLETHAPAVTVATVRNSEVDVASELATGGVDLALGWMPKLGPGFFQRRLFEQHHRCLMSANHPLAKGALTLPRFLKAKHAVVISAGTGHARVETIMRQRGIKRIIALELPHFAAVPYIVQNTALIATVPEKLVDGALLPSGLVVRVPPIDELSFQVNMFWHRRVHEDGANKWLRNAVAVLFQESKSL
ncbi:MAG: LysR family transcriptional regulator [Betaproteobacteria bacterium]|nr:MAG: LysR family transcriptional regulator [Betaproteobacteria bacterium]